jgi:hypothetical protein
MDQALLIHAHADVKVQERAFLQDAALPARLMGLMTFCAVYCLAPVLHLPMLRYFPVLHTWSFSLIPGATSMSYFGLLLYGALAWAGGYAVGRIPAVRRFLNIPAVTRFVIFASIGAVVCALGFYLVSELCEWGSKQL